MKNLEDYWQGKRVRAALAFAILPRVAYRCAAAVRLEVAGIAFESGDCQV